MAAAAVVSNRRLMTCTFAVALVAGVWAVRAQVTPAPTSQPATQPAATQPMSPYDRLLGSPDNERADTPIQPVATGSMIDQTTGVAAVAPNAPQLATRREGTFLPRLVGRMTKSTDPDGGWEFTLDADGQALQDPPLKLLPNLKLMAMEQQRETLNRDVRFRVSGLVTEYRGRNYLLVSELQVLRDPP